MVGAIVAVVPAQGLDDERVWSERVGDALRSPLVSGPSSWPGSKPHA
jgi:hypothetical protein